MGSGKGDEQEPDEETNVEAKNKQGAKKPKKNRFAQNVSKTLKRSKGQKAEKEKGNKKPKKPAKKVVQKKGKKGKKPAKKKAEDKSIEDLAALELSVVASEPKEEVSEEPEEEAQVDEEVRQEVEELEATEAKEEETNEEDEDEESKEEQDSPVEAGEEEDTEEEEEKNTKNVGAKSGTRGLDQLRYVSNRFLNLMSTTSTSIRKKLVTDSKQSGRKKVEDDEDNLTDLEEAAEMDDRDGTEQDDSEYRKRRFRVRIILVVGVIVFYTLVILSLVFGIATTPDEEPTVAPTVAPTESPVVLSVDVESLLFEGEFLAEVGNQTLFGAPSEEFFIAHVNVTDNSDPINFLGGCKVAPVACLIIGYENSGLFIVGDCDSATCSESQSSTIEFPQLAVAGVEVTSDGDGVQSLGVRFADDNFFEAGVPVAQSGPGFFAIDFQTLSIDLAGFFGYLDENGLTGMGFILRDTSVSSNEL